MEVRASQESSARPRRRKRWSYLKNYVNAIRAKPSRGVLLGLPTKKEVAASWLASLIGIAAVTSIHYYSSTFVVADIPVVVASFGASAVLIYATIESPLAQPRCLVGGHILSALVGVTVEKIITALAEATGTDVLDWRSTGCAVAVACAITVMQITKTTHPPGGATALAAVLGPNPVWHLGYLYVLSPVALGASLLLFVAIIVNNLFGRRYPQYWIYPTPPVLQSMLSPPSPEPFPKLEGSASMLVNGDHRRSVDSGDGRGRSKVTGDLKPLEHMLEHGAAVGVGDGQVGGEHGGVATAAAARFSPIPVTRGLSMASETLSHIDMHCSSPESDMIDVVAVDGGMPLDTMRRDRDGNYAVRMEDGNGFSWS